MKPPFRCVPDSLSADTVTALEVLLSEARSGKLLGMAFVAMYRDRTFIANTTGEAQRNPVFSRGMVACLDDRLGTLID